MPLQRWQKVRQVFEVRNPWWAYRRDDVLLPTGGRGEYHLVHTNGASMIIPVLDNGSLLLVNQYRYLCDRESLEFPCGGVKEGSSYEETALHELSEETGYRTTDLKVVGQFNPFNGVTDEVCRIFVARDLVPVASLRDETEEFEQVVCTIDALDGFIRDGRIWDGMTLAAWALIRHQFIPM